MKHMGLSPRLPIDPDLPGLAALLDPEQFAGASAQLLPADTQVTECRPLYVRYKPRTNAIAVFEIYVAGHDRPLLFHGKCHAADDYELARDKASDGRWVDPVLGRPFASIDKYCLLLFSFPNDQALDGLRFAASPKRLQRALYAHEPALNDQEWRVSDSRMAISPVRFKPEKRAVLRMDTKAVHRAGKGKKQVRIYARVNRNGQGLPVSDLMTRLNRNFSEHPIFCTPRVVVHLELEQTTLVADVGGQPLSLNTTGVATAGRVLAHLHPTSTRGLESRDSRAIMSAVAESIATIAKLAPELEQEALDLLVKMRRRSGDHMDDDASGFVHGDYHPLQLLKLQDRVALLDFDRSYQGDQMADLGNYIAHLIYGNLVSGPDRKGLDSLRESLIKAYTEETGRHLSRPDLSFWTAVGLLQLAPSPFRVLHPDWPAILTATLAACRKELSCC